jgi:TonB family protein
VNVAAYAPPVAPSTPPPTFESTQKPSRRFPLAAAAAIGAVAVLGGGAYWMFAAKSETPAKPVAIAKVAAPAPQPAPPKAAPVIPEPIVVQSPSMASAAPAPQTSTTDSEAARKKAFEDAVKQRMNQEMMKLQAQYTRGLQQKQSKNAPVQSASLAAPTLPQQLDEKPSISAAQLDQQRLTSSRTETVQPSPVVAHETTAPVVPVQQATPQPAAPLVHEGDVIEITDVDHAPKALAEIRPTPSPLAVRQHVQGSVVVTVFVSEDGNVLDAKVLSGIGKFGIDEAALRAAKNARFSPATKEGKRVKTWMPLRFDFKL